MIKRRYSIFMVCIALSLSACNGGTETGTGTLSLAITDAPVLEDVEVCVHFSSITLHHADGDQIQIPYDSASYYDAMDGCSSNVPSDDPGALHNAVALSALQGALNVQLMDSLEVKAGNYNWIRLEVDESLSYVVDSLGQHSLSCPSCGSGQSGLKLNRGITVPVGGAADFIIDVDLAKALNRQPTGDYKLRPTLRLIDMAESGHINGTVAASLIPGLVSVADTGCKVYAYSGHDITPDDFHDADNVLTSARVLYEGSSMTYQYHIAYLPADSAVGSSPYTVALTCDNDDPAIDQNNDPAALGGDDVIFGDGLSDGVGRNADVFVNRSTRIDFSPAG